MDSLIGTSPIAGARVLFVRPGVKNTQQLFALDHYASAAARAGMNVGVLGSFPEHPEAKGLVDMGEFPPFRVTSPGGFITRLRNFGTAMRDFQPDIVHVRNHLGSALLPWLRRWLSPGTKMVLDIRTMAPSRPKHWMAHTLRSVNGKGYQHVFALNQSILNAYIRSGVNTSILPLGFDDKIFRPDSNNASFTPGQRLRCIYYGSMNQVRGMETLIHGLIQALDAGVDLEANLVGEGNDKNRLSSMVPSSYADRIKFHAFADQMTLSNILRSHHIGLAYVPDKPVFSPNLPLKTVEMLASGIPVIATRTLGNREIVNEGDSGFLVPDTPEGIKEGLIRASRGEGAMAAEPITRAASVEDYGWSGLAERYLFPVYSHLLHA